MGLWGKPNIERLIRNKDVKGLNKALETKDYEIVKSAIVGLINLHEMILDETKILYLIGDRNPKIRLIAYKFFMPFDHRFLLANVAALHDCDVFNRQFALNTLSTFAMPTVYKVIERLGLSDPDPTIRNSASKYYDDFISKNPENASSYDIYSGGVGLDWFSNVNLFAENKFLLKIFDDFSPQSAIDLGVSKDVINQIRNFTQPYEIACREKFDLASDYLLLNENITKNLLLSMHNIAILGLNNRSSASFTTIQLVAANDKLDKLLDISIILMAKLNCFSDNF